MSTGSTPATSSRLKAYGTIVAILAGVFGIVEIVTKQPLVAVIVAMLGAVIVSVYYIRKGYVIETIVAWLTAIVIGLLVSTFKPTGTVEGKISANETPVINEQVSLVDAVGVEHKTKTDKEGRYEFRDIPEGEFTMRVREITGGGVITKLVWRTTLNFSVTIPAPTQSSLLSTSTEIPATLTTPTNAPDPSFAPSLTSTPSCPYAAGSDDETIRVLIAMEAEAVNRKSIDIILTIFSAEAAFADHAVPAGQSPRTWFGPLARYRDDLFINTDLKDTTHFDILPAGPGISGDTAFYTSGSKGSYKVGDNWEQYFNASTVGEEPTLYGSDHWTLRRDANSCWVIVRLDFNAGHVPFPP